MNAIQNMVRLRRSLARSINQAPCSNARRRPHQIVTCQAPESFHYLEYSAAASLCQATYPATIADTALSIAVPRRLSESLPLTSVTTVPMKRTPGVVGEALIEATGLREEILSTPDPSHCSRCC